MSKVIRSNGSDPHIVGAMSTGVTKKVAQALGREIKGAYRLRGKSVRLKGMRFVPSSRVDLDDGHFEVLANTVVEVTGSGRHPNRSESVESVLTIGREKTSQVLRAVKTPALERMQISKDSVSVTP